MRSRDVHDFGRLAILCTNRQIYIEASYILHSDLTVRLEARDIMVGKNSQTIWRHDPCYGRGVINKNGEYVYNTPKLGGRLEPHVFARLRRIQYDALLVFLDAPIISLRQDFTIEPQFQKYYMRYIREANVTHIKRFVKSIFHSPIIYHLKINFGIESVRYHDPGGFFGIERFEEMHMAANRQARDTFVHCGVLGPLRTLHNVRSFNLGFFGEENAEDFPVWLAELAKDIKRTVERNCTEQDTS